MEDVTDIVRLLSDPTAKADPQWVADMHRRHPAFVVPALLLLKRNPDALDAHSRQRLQSACALNCADRLALADYIDPSAAGWADFYPRPQPVSPTTEQTIDDFISAYGTPATSDEDALLEKLILNPVAADYFAGTDEPYDPGDPLALPPELMPSDDTDDTDDESQDQESASGGATDVRKPESARIGGEDTLFMESLAKIFIKQQRYERAYEIISKLSLNYPEKSVYFADQLRFLQKLMINQRHQTT